MRDNVKKTVTIKEINGLFSIVKSDEFKPWELLFLKVKGSFFRELCKKNPEDNFIKKIKEKVTSISDGVNLDLLSDYLIENESDLVKYLDK